MLRLPTSLCLLLVLVTASPAQRLKTEIEAAEGAYCGAMLKEDIRWFEKNLAAGYSELDLGRNFKRAKALAMLRDSFATSRRRSYESTSIKVDGNGATARSTSLTTFVLEDTRPKAVRLRPTELKAQVRKTWTQTNGLWYLSRLEVLKLISLKELKS